MVVSGGDIGEEILPQIGILFSSMREKWSVSGNKSVQ
jgi:hypothetical protein